MKKIYLLATIVLMTQGSFGAELFVRVMRSGSHIATAYNQTQTNSTTTFRFFELPGGNITIQITDQQNGYNVFNGYLNIAANQRVVAELDYNGSLQILQTIVISSSNWYTSNPGNVVYNPNPYPNNGYPTNGYPNNGYPNNGNGNGYCGTDHAAFSQFLKIMDDEPFDSNKLETARSYAAKTNLSAQQITDISKKFTFDSNRLDWAKSAYGRCYDKANYFLLKSTFTFSSNYSALEDYIEGQ
jgi:hypothetical protein